MKKYIDLDFLEKRAIKMHGFGDARYISLRTAQAAPNVEMKPVIHAHWKDHTFCSHCGGFAEDEEGYITMSFTDFCPYCGAIMDEEKER